MMHVKERSGSAPEQREYSPACSCTLPRSRLLAEHVSSGQSVLWKLSCEHDVSSSFSTSKESSSQDVESTFPEDCLHKSKTVNTPLPSSRSCVEMPAHPAPRAVTEEEIHFVKTCLQRWRSEIEQDIQGWLF